VSVSGNVSDSIKFKHLKNHFKEQEKEKNE